MNETKSSDPNGYPVDDRDRDTTNNWKKSVTFFEGLYLHPLQW